MSRECKIMNHKVLFNIIQYPHAIFYEFQGIHIPVNLLKAFIFKKIFSFTKSLSNFFCLDTVIDVSVHMSKDLTHRG